MRLSKVAATVSAMAMLFVSTMTAMAATSDPNMTVADGTAYSTRVAAGQTVTLKVGPANSAYSYTGFSSLADAKSGLTYTYNCGSDKVASVVTDGVTLADGTHAGTLAITGASGSYGPASLHVMNATNNNAYIDMSVYVESATTVGDATGVTVEVVDIHGDFGTYEYAESVTVKAAANSANSPFKGSTGCAQSYPTAADALYSMEANGNISIDSQYEGYVYTITDSQGTEVAAYYSESGYYGWNYCVVRNGAKVAEGDVVSSSILEVKNGDCVYWAFGTATEAADYFAELY